MQFVDKLARPTAPDGTEQRKVIILEEEEGDASLFIEAAHLAHDLYRLARAHYPSRRGAIEGMDRAERTGPGASPAGQYRHHTTTQHPFRLVVAFRIRQLIQVFDLRARRRGRNLVIAKIRDALNVVPIFASADCIRQFEQREFAFEADNTVQSGNQFKRGLVTEAGEMAPHCEVTINILRAQPTH